MIEILPAHPCTAAKPQEPVIDLVAMKQYGEWLATKGSEAQYEAYHFGNFSFADRHAIAVQWAQRRNYEFDAGRGDYHR